MEEKTDFQRNNNNDLMIHQFRTRIRVVIIGLLLFSLVFINIYNFPFVNKQVASVIVAATILYIIFYQLIIAKHLHTKLQVMLGVLSMFTLVVIVIYATGASKSIFTAIIFLFPLFTGITIGFSSLLIITIMIQCILVFFFLTEPNSINNQTVILFFLTSSIYNITNFIVGFTLMKEYSNREQRLNKATISSEEHERVSKEKDELVAIVSHEFRTPLSVIKGYVNMIMNNNGKISKADEQTFLSNIITNITRLESIVEKTVDISLFETGTISLFLQPVDFEKLVRDTINNTLNIIAEEKKLELIIKLPDVRLPLISADPQYMEQAVINLIDNAIKYTNQGSITVTLSKEPEYVVFKVTDTGIGIPQEDLPYLFQKFHRLGDYKVRTIAGSGLGLYLTKRIIDKHKGTISVESVVNKGTMFTVKLPIPKNDETWN